MCELRCTSVVVVVVVLQVVPEKREFSMAMSSVADTLGISAAGFLAIPVHNWLCQLPAPTA